MRPTRLALLVPMIMACGGGGEHDAAPVSQCEAPYVARGAECVPRFDDCRDDAVPDFGGGCTTIGVPKDGCAEGFVHDGAGGCTPTLPAAACAQGELAVPGDTACRAVATCGSGTWGDIPVEADTIYVDGSAPDGGDGTKDKPLRTIVAALAKIGAGKRPIVAIAAGTYAEDVLIDGSARLFGVCPSKVQIQGISTTYGAIEAHGDVEVHGVSVTGPGLGIVGAVGCKLTVESTWVHDTASDGIAIYETGTPKKATIRNVLVEHASEFGIYVNGGDLTVERTAVRDVQPIAQKSGMGIRAEIYAKASHPAKLEVRGSLIERNREAGIASLASNVVVQGTVVRDTKSRVIDGKLGSGIIALEYPKTTTPAELSVLQSFVEKNQRSGIYVLASNAKVDRTVIANNLPRATDKGYGNGIEALERSTLAVQDSLVTSNLNVGIAFGGATGSVERTLVRDTQPTASTGLHGEGIAVWVDGAFVSDVSVRHVRVAGNHSAAITVGGSKLVVEDSALLGTLARPDAQFGDGLCVTSWFGATPELQIASTSMVRTLVANNARAGVLDVGGGLHIGDSLLLCNALDLQVSDDLGSNAGGESILRAANLANDGHVTCGCDAVSAVCKAQSSTLQALGNPGGEH